jgi:hypothetical protein
MLPDAEMLPHLICSRPTLIGGAKNEAGQRSVGGGGNRLPPPTRWVCGNVHPYRDPLPRAGAAATAERNDCYPAKRQWFFKAVILAGVGV